jgi:hypothetical protein
MAPPRKISSEMTPAKMGRSMKNLEKFMLCPIAGRSLERTPAAQRRVAAVY